MMAHMSDQMSSLAKITIADQLDDAKISPDKILKFVASQLYVGKKTYRVNDYN